MALVIWQGLRLVATGTAIGIGAALASSRLLEHLLYEVRPLDPLIYVAVCVGSIAIAILACLVPARRATRVDPIIAIRSD